jgi:hypothetical protein
MADRFSCLFRLKSNYDFTSFSIGRLDAAIALLIAYTEIAFGVMQAELLYQKS